MSLIASGYGLTTSDLQAIGARLANSPNFGIWDLIRDRRIGPPPREGSLFLTLDEFLRSRGVELPINLSADGARALADGGFLLALANGAEAAATNLALQSFGWTNRELGQFWEEFNGLQAPEAGEAMRTGIEWLSEVFAAGVAAEWCFVQVG